MNLAKYKRELKLREAQKLAKDAFVTVCQDCGDIISIRYDLGQKGLSHGLCQKDFERRMKEEA